MALGVERRVKIEGKKKMRFNALANSMNTAARPDLSCQLFNS